MPDQQPEPPVRVPIGSLFGATVSALVGGGIAYVVVGGVLQAETFKSLPFAQWIQAGLAIVVGVTTLAVGYRDLRNKARIRAAARAATVRVDEALKDLTDESGPGMVASVSKEDVAASVGDARIEADHLTRLVEQRKQQMLVHKKTLQPDLVYLIDNWHPLPRNVKRGLNRFYVSLLIAYNRGLLTETPAVPPAPAVPPVSGRQLAKWLVLSERGPQLGRALVVWPDRIGDLERDAPLRPPKDSLDSFKAILGTLTPLYVEDGGLREFLASWPPLTPVLERLIYYGAAQPVQPTAQPPAASDPGVPAA